jgi:hypothetical protein
MHCYNFYHLFHTQFSSDRLFYIKGAMAEKYFLQIKVEDSDNTTDCPGGNNNVPISWELDCSGVIRNNVFSPILVHTFLLSHYH